MAPAPQVLTLVCDFLDAVGYPPAAKQRAGPGGAAATIDSGRLREQLVLIERAVTRNEQLPILTVPLASPTKAGSLSGALSGTLSMATSVTTM